jgi:peptidoglycan/LPS O-acetylase OafA/YrhL
MANPEPTTDSPSSIPPATSRHWLDGFRRITSSGQYIPEIDGLRFIAITLVVIYHVLVFVCITQGLKVGRIDTLTRGVEMFFVLSGFILAIPFAAQFILGDRRVCLKSYFIRRLTRLEPPYLICLLIYTAMKSLQHPDYFPRILNNAWMSALYVHNAILGEHSMVLSVAWSLEVEVQFYLLMPLLAYVFAIRPTWLRRAIVIAAALLVPLTQPINFPALVFPNDGHLLNEIQYFLAGLLLADIWAVEWNNAPPPEKSGSFPWGDLLCLLIFPFLLLGPPRASFPERLTLAPLIFLLYLAMFRSLWCRRLMRIQILTLIGGMCYSIYLMHNLVIQMVGALWMHVMPTSFLSASLLSCLIMLPTSLIVSAIYFRLIERPCMRRDWPRRLYAWILSLIFIEDSSNQQNTVGNPPGFDR